MKILKLALYFVILTIIFLLVSILWVQAESTNKLVDDRKITIVRPADVALKRKQLVRFIWGEAGFPAEKLPSEILIDGNSPIPDLNDLERAETLIIKMDGGVDASAYQYEEISMIGISGGGWTTTLYAALDPEIRFSFPVAGSLPLYLRYPGYNHDKEQYLPAFYKIAGYPDLYLLGSYGPGRQQVQILNRRDNCCFGENQHNAEMAGMPWETSVRSYGFNVQAALRSLGSGSFFLYIDETTTRHEISENTIVDVVLPVMEGRHVPALISTNELDK